MSTGGLLQDRLATTLYCYSILNKKVIGTMWSEAAKEVKLKKKIVKHKIPVITSLFF